MNKTLCTLILALLSLAFGSPDSATAQGLFTLFEKPKIGVNLDQPPEYGLEVSRIAFGPTEGGPCADEIVSGLVEDLIQRGIDVLDREHLNSILQEHNLVMSGMVDESTAIELGRILGATTLIFVNVQRCVDDQTRRHEDKKTKDGTRRKYFAVTETHLKGSVRVVDLETARIFSAKTLEESGRAEESSYEGLPEFPSKYAIHDLVIHQGIFEINKLLFPWTEVLNMPVFNDKACGLKDTYRLMKVGDFSGAEEMARANLGRCNSKDKIKARAHYNLGVALMAQGSYNEAQNLFNQSFRLQPSGKAMQRAVTDSRRAIEVAEAMRLYRMRGGQMAPQHPGSPFEDPGSIAATPGAASVEERLRKLERLRESGLITEKEYQGKRQEILADL